MSEEQQAAAVLEGDVILEGEVETAPEVMACEHAVSKARVARAWEARERRSSREQASDGMCACCGLPCRPNAQRCLVCSRAPFGQEVQARLPYARSSW